MDKTGVGLNVATRSCNVYPDKYWFAVLSRFWLQLGYGYIGAETDTTLQTNICLGIHRGHVWPHLIRHVCPDL
jgi:hypothetical protein